MNNFPLFTAVIIQESDNIESHMFFPLESFHNQSPGIPCSENKDPFVQSAVAFWHYNKNNYQECLQLLKRLAKNKAAHPDLVAFAESCFKPLEEDDKKKKKKR